MECTEDQFHRVKIRSDGRTERFVDVDLSPLRHHETLWSLSLVDNGLKRLDFAPLSSCIELHELGVTGSGYWGPLESLDLSPLSSCSKLTVLNLSNDGLQNIELFPLRPLTRLKSLCLSSNRLQRLDLSPLSSCMSLYNLDLGGNKLQSVDLSPLSSCPSLSELSLAANELESIDLAPLASCQCSRLSVNANRIKSADITPVVLNPALEYVGYIDFNRFDSVRLTSLTHDPFPKRIWKSTTSSSFQEEYGRTPLDYKVENKMLEGSWELLHKICGIPQALSIPIQTYVLNALGLSAFGLIDKDITDFLQSIPPQISLEEARETVKPFLVETVCEQIDGGGTTILLDINALVDIGEITYRADSILKLRDTEMKRVRVWAWSNTYGRRRHYISPLVLTAYGFPVFLRSRSGDALELTDKEYEPVQEMFKGLGYDITVFEDADYDQDQYVPTNMSRQMKNYVINLFVRMRRDELWYSLELEDALRRAFRAPHLRALLQEHNLSSKGTKRELASRLIEAMGTDGVRRILEEHSE